MDEICKPYKEAILDIELPKNHKRLSKAHKENLENIHAYRDFLLSLKILDPACGSGAFLNEALNFLINEHEFVDSLRRAYEGDALGFDSVETQILENNLYGVDINSGAVEIAKLSLWLRTAQIGRKLTNLSKNLVVANSLTEFPFKDIKFDVVIGNPPYVRQEMIKDQKEALSKIYEVYNGTADLYVYFYELGLRALKSGGYLGFICSNKFFRAKYGSNLRKYILENSSVKDIVDFDGIKVFEDATVDSAMTVFKKEISENSTFKFRSNLDEAPQILPQHSLSKESFIFLNPLENSIKQKIENKGTPLKEWNIDINFGIKTGLNDAFIIDIKTKDEILDNCKSIDEKERTTALIKPLLRGRDIKRYSYEWANLWLINTHNGYDEVEAINIDEYPSIKEHLDKFFPKLGKRGDKGKTPYNLRSCAYLEEFEKDIISWQRVTQIPSFILSKDIFILDSMAFLSSKNSEILKYFLVILNSKAIFFYFKNIGHLYSDTGFLLSNQYVERFPIPQISTDEMVKFESLATTLLGLNQKLNETKKNFLDELGLDKVSKKLEEFYLLSFDEFIKEFAKAKKQKFKDKLDERNFKAEWQRLFETDKSEILTLLDEIKQADTKADELVYALFELNSDEINLIENSL